MLIFGMKAHLINKHLLVLRSRSFAEVKVGNQGYISQKIAVSRALVFYKHIFRVATCQGKVREIIFLKVRELSGNFVNCQ